MALKHGSKRARNRILENAIGQAVGRKKARAWIAVLTLGAAAFGYLQQKPSDSAPIRRQAQVEATQQAQDFGQAEADIVTGRVVKVSDGDTITVLDANQRQIKVRMLGIDAPEKSQPFGSRCREQLAEVVAGKEVRISTRKRDRYQRVLSKVMVDGRDANLSQVQAGCAWHYKQYARDQAAADRETYAAAEQEARSARRGLWKDAEPEAPWAFRQASRGKSSRRGISAERD